MTRITVSHRRLEDARSLPEVLDAAYEAFEDMMTPIYGKEQPRRGFYAAPVMAAAARPFTCSSEV